MPVKREEEAGTAIFRKKIPVYKRKRDEINRPFSF